MTEVKATNESPQYEKQVIRVVVQKTDLWGNITYVEQDVEVFVRVEPGSKAAAEAKAEEKKPETSLDQMTPVENLIDINPKWIPSIEEFIKKIQPTSTILEQKTGMAGLLLAATNNPKLLDKRFPYAGGNGEETRTLGFFLAKQAVDQITGPGKENIGYLRSIYDGDNVTAASRSKFYEHLNTMLLTAIEEETRTPKAGFRLSSVLTKQAAKLTERGELSAEVLIGILSDPSKHDCFYNENGELTEVGKRIEKLANENSAFRDAVLKAGLVKMNGKKVVLNLSAPVRSTEALAAPPLEETLEH